MNNTRRQELCKIVNGLSNDDLMFIMNACSDRIDEQEEEQLCEILDEDDNGCEFIESRISYCECCDKYKPNIKWFKKCIKNMKNKYSICKKCEEDINIS